MKRLIRKVLRLLGIKPKYAAGGIVTRSRPVPNVVLRNGHLVYGAYVVHLSSGVGTYIRPGETATEAMKRLTHGEDL